MKKNPFHNVIYLRNNKFKEIYTKPLFIETVPQEQVSLNITKLLPEIKLLIIIKLVKQRGV